MEVYVDDESKLTLHGLQQHYVKLKDNEKNRKLFELLDVLEFNQVSIVSARPLSTVRSQLVLIVNKSTKTWLPSRRSSFSSSRSSAAWR